MKNITVVMLAALLCSPAMAKNDKAQKGAEPMPQGMEKKATSGGQLPPGWQKKLQKGHPLEPELYRMAQPVPVSMRSMLPAGPKGSVMIRLDSKIVRLNGSTHVILDVFDAH